LVNCFASFIFSLPPASAGKRGRKRGRKRERERERKEKTA